MRKTQESIKESILSFLLEGPKNIKEISEKINSNWPTTNSYLEKLKDKGKVGEVLTTDKMKVFRRTDDPIYFSLPFDREIRMKTLYILKKISEEWEVSDKKNKLSKTGLQKVAVDVIETCKVDLPVLDFHYGKTTCASLDLNNEDIVSSINMPEKKFKKMIDKCIFEVVQKKEHTGVAGEEIEYQYSQSGMEFYNAKNELLESFSEANTKEIKEGFTKLSLHFPMKLYNCHGDFMTFLGYSNLILSSGSSENIQKIKEVFFQLWDKLTTTSSLEGIERFMQKEKWELFSQMKSINLTYKDMSYKAYIEELEAITEGINPFEIDFPKTESSRQIQRLIVESLGDE